tara:strand:- start:8312 stop:8647 length:336 start_codon:yes stop_codon:yes gene_type:complete
MRTLEVHYCTLDHDWKVEAFDGDGNEMGYRRSYGSMSQALHEAHLEAEASPINTVVNVWQDKPFATVRIQCKDTAIIYEHKCMTDADLADWVGDGDYETVNIDYHQQAGAA